MNPLSCVLCDECKEQGARLQRRTNHQGIPVCDGKLEDMDEWKVTKVVLKELGYAPEKKKEKRTPVLSHEEMKAALLTG